MEQKSRKKLTKNTFILLVSVFLVIGIACFVVGFGISKGWDVVAWWFTSKYAVILYVLLGLYAVFAIWILIYEKIRKMW